jgi:hypothetical protein
MTTSENKQARDYSHEHNLRMKRNKRFVVELNKEKAEQFDQYLKGQGLTFSEWAKNNIDKELKA